ncbi:unnamed protein product [Caenorhabditis sp. 36 PRJEB53466]|nr:unnamed protein product [Caenorhabditis sp. 36 PRJEB53466]
MSTEISPIQKKSPLLQALLKKPVFTELTVRSPDPPVETVSPNSSPYTYHYTFYQSPPTHCLTQPNGKDEDPDRYIPVIDQFLKEVRQEDKQKTVKIQPPAAPLAYNYTPSYHNLQPMATFHSNPYKMCHPPHRPHISVPYTFNDYRIPPPNAHRFHQMYYAPPAYNNTFDYPALQ